MTDRNQPSQDEAAPSKLKSLIWIVIPTVLILMGLAAMFHMTP